ncbi:MAG: aminopeptidase P family protein [Anaerolineae bacterium]|nr:aminopeptidase P family protein [Anaerolineae bacterium]
MQLLTAEGCAARRHALIENAQLDYFIITSPRHIQYFSGFYITPLALSYHGRNFLLIDARSGKSTLLVHNFLADAKKIAHVDQVDVWTWYDVNSNPGVEPYGKALQELNARLPDLSGKRVGYEAGWLPVGVNVGTAELVDVTEVILTMRRRKYADELVLIREAIAANEAGHRASRTQIKVGMSEVEAQAIIHQAMMLSVGHDLLLICDFASGVQRIKAGGPGTTKIIAPGDLLLLDMNPVVNGYRSDFTATISLDGKPTEAEQNLLLALHEGMAAGESKLKPGSTGGEIHEALRQALQKRGFAEGFPHHAGHGLGLGHPEAPYFVPNSREALQAGDVVTLEPGSYGDGFAARIEHNYLITETGYEQLSHHDTRLVAS